MEDIAQQTLVHRYLEECGHNVRDCRFERAAKRRGGSGEQFVRKQYPIEVKEHRRRRAKGASALLVVMVDADSLTTHDRAAQLERALGDAGEDLRGGGEPIVVLIPKRHVETWIQALLGSKVNETRSYKTQEATSSDIRQAAGTLYTWTRPNASVGETCPPSLTDAIPEWQKIPC